MGICLQFVNGIGAGVVGGIAGLAVGLAYDATVLGPFFAAIASWDDDPRGRSFGHHVLSHFLSPVTLAVKGAKEGFNIATKAFDG